MRSAFVISLLVLLGSLPASGGPIDEFEEFGEIQSIVSVFEHGWILGGGVELEDEKKQSLKVCVGFSPDQSHWGFRIGSLHPADEGSEIVEIGSDCESRLVDLFASYLNRTFTYSQRQRLSSSGDLQSLGKSKKYDAYLASILRSHGTLSEMWHWLNSNFSVEQQSKLANTPFLELETDIEREALGYIRNLQLGILPQNEDLLRREYLKDYILVDCGHDSFTIVDISTYYDGGTVGISVTDSSGCLVDLCVDHGISSLTSGAMYIGSRSPTSPSAKLASLSEEKRVVELLRRVLDMSYQRDRQLALFGSTEVPRMPNADELMSKLQGFLRGRGAL